MLSAGTVLRLQGGPWTVAGPLDGATGGFGTLYVVTSEFGQPAVAKLVDKDPGAERELLLGDSLAAAKYRNVVRILDQGEHDSAWVIVMPRAETSLADYLANRDAALGLNEILPILTDIATALQEVASKIVHRDLKPGNVLFLNGVWCLADFGIARYADAATASDTRKHSLTPPYAAPEQWRAERATSATDVYAFGLIAYELLAGRLPFSGPRPEDYREQHLNSTPPAIDRGTRRLRDLISECLLKAQEARPTPAAIVQRLARIENEPVVGGFAQLAEVNEVELADRAEKYRQASVDQQRLESRQRLHEAARALFEPIGTDLVEAIRDNAPTVEVDWSGRSNMTMHASLRGAKLVLGVPQPSETDWDSPFTVISECTVSVTSSRPLHGYEGRSHSLWYCDAETEGEFFWYEIAFMNSGLTFESASVPFALTAAEGRTALTPVFGGTQVAWFSKVDSDERGDFLDRWLSWFAQAARGRLQKPMMLPERSASGMRRL